MLYYLLFWTILGFIFHFYIIFGTNLLTEGPAQNCCFFCLFQCFEETEYQTESKWNETFGNVIFSPNVIQKTWTLRQGIREAVTRVGGTPPASWAPRCSFDVLLPPIYTYVPQTNRRGAKKSNSIAATFCIHEIPSWGLFRSSTGGGIDHGGLLHHHPSPSDEVWVVYFRPSGP